MEVLDPADPLLRSDLIAYPACPPSTMDIGEARSASSTRSGLVSERAQAIDFPDVSSHHPSQPSSTAPSIPANVSGNSNNRSQTIPSQRAPPMSEPHPDFYTQHQGATVYHPSGTTPAGLDSQPPQTAPPPSPRLQPSHGSVPSLNGSAQTSPSRIKVRDLSHIHSFASEEVLTRSRHPFAAFFARQDWWRSAI